MEESEVLHKDHDEMIALYKHMKPEERLVAFFHHSQLIHRLYQAGVDYRLSTLPPSNEKLLKR